MLLNFAFWYASMFYWRTARLGVFCFCVEFSLAVLPSSETTEVHDPSTRRACERDRPQWRCQVRCGSVSFRAWPEVCSF